MIATLLFVLIVILLLQLLFSFVPGVDQRIVGIVILLVVLALLFDRRGPGRFFGAVQTEQSEAAS